MRLWPNGVLSRPSIFASPSTLFTLLTVSLATPTTTATTSAAISNTFAPQRTFRLGRPAAFASHPYTTMSASASLPAQTESFSGFASSPVLAPTAETSQLVRDAMELFGARPSAAIFARWSPGAVFADPICHAEGYAQYLAQWYGMPAAFAHSETLAWKLITQQDDRVEYVQLQRYKVKGLGVTKDMVSTVVMQRDPATNTITRFEDRWNHKPLGGVFSWPFRRLNAFTLPWIVGVPKETKQVMQDKTPTAGQKDL
ncbi:uncharacterized protein SRS1_14327 [Sporisorium reilianum f. sp. reilianum]|uniref:SnoaL-like domain-containing protein n=1 Tax=Sporisorium reilianum f. sp. reilianum TaxID=72559 RepID=A0A2N8UGM5_9BASI|nr:uncharacterized protein SRS1_14327 [Sporisorium reilianum f. sp. reilianum]